MRHPPQVRVRTLLGLLPPALSILAILVIPAVSISAGPKPMYFPNSAWTGEDFHDREGMVRELYVNGLIDGMLGAPLFGGDSDLARALHACVLPMKIKQVTAVLAKYIDDHPETWHESMYFLANLSLTAVCADLSAAEVAYYRKRNGQS